MSSGKRHELQIKKSLEAYGCVVTLSSASRGASDLVIRYKGSTFECQAKYGKHPTIPPTERRELYDCAEAGGNIALACLRVRGAKETKWFRVVEDSGGGCLLQPWTPPWRK